MKRKQIDIRYTFSWEQMQELAKEFGASIALTLSKTQPRLEGENQKWKIFGVPRGGVHVAQLLVAQCPQWFVMSPDGYSAHAIVDDIVDSGSTRELLRQKVPHIPFFALIDKQQDEDYKGKWIVFPWEADEEQPAEENVRRLLQLIGEDPKREGLLDTPKRFIKALREYTKGYGIDPADILKVSFDIADADPELTYDQIIMSGPLPYNSMCEHHLAPFEGHAWIAYLPAKDGKIAGLSKLARVLDAFSQRLQVQERLTVQIANAIEKHLEPRGVAVLIRGRHLCQCHRGVKKDGRMITSVVRGVFTEQAARNEFLEMVKLSSI